MSSSTPLAAPTPSARSSRAAAMDSGVLTEVLKCVLIAAESVAEVPPVE